MNDKERIIDATDLVRLIGDHVALRPSGREFVGICPFHDDHNPSMAVVTHKERPFFKCHSCGAGGDAISFVQLYYKMEFREALEYLAERAGIELTEFAKPQHANPSGISKKDLERATATAQDFFRAIFNHEQHGVEGRKLAERREITPDIVERFAIGMAPPIWDGLSQTVRSKNLNDRPFREVGLFKSRQDGTTYDTFRNRLMFPIRDMRGVVVGFGGRRIDDEEDPKYLNSPESPLYDKGSTLYGVFEARDAIRNTGTAIVTEGYMDVIACHAAGFENAVAALGTALTATGARVLERLCHKIVLLFDGDEAGRKAADRAVEVLFNSRVDVRIAILDGADGAKDPDDLLKRDDGAERFRQLIENAEDAVDYRIHRLRERTAGLGMAGKERAIDEELGVFVRLGLANMSSVRREQIVHSIAQLLHVPDDAVRQSIAAHNRRRRPATDEPSATPMPNRARSQRDRLLGCILAEPSVLVGADPAHREVIRPDAYPPGVTREVAEAIQEVEHLGETPSLERVRQVVNGDALTAAINLCDEVERQNGSDPERIRSMWRHLIERISTAQLNVSGTDSLESLANSKRKALGFIEQAANEESAGARTLAENGGTE